MKMHPDTLPLRVPAGYAGPEKSLVLAGGGMRLAYQAGVLKALEEQGLQFTHGDGTSGGIMNLAMLLSGLSVEAMCRNWRTVRIKDFVSYLPLRKYLHPFRIPAFGDADGIVQKVFPHLGIDLARINSEQQLQGTFNVCNFSNKTNEAIPQDQVTLAHLVAGISLPIFMPATKIGNDWYIDSVWIKDANLLEAVRRGAEEIWLVWAIGNGHEYRSGSFNQYVHMIEMSANGALFAELDYLNELNSRIAKGDSPYGQKQQVKVHIIRPEYPLPLDTDLYFNKINTTTLIEFGYADAMHYLKGSTAPATTPTPAATKMKSQGIAFSCRTRSSGRLLNRDVVLHLSFTLHDLYRFISNNEKAYQLAGSISSASGEEVWYGYHGKLIIATEEDRREKAAQLQLLFRIAGEEHLLAATVPLQKGFARKAAAATEVRLYKGSSEGGTPVSKAVFEANPADWSYTKKSVSFYNTNNWLEKRRARKALKKYFSGSG